MTNINAWEGLLLLSTAGLAATTQRLTDICHSDRYLQQPARSVLRNNHMGSEYVSREKKITYGKFFDFRAQKCT